MIEDKKFYRKIVIILLSLLLILVFGFTRIKMQEAEEEATKLATRKTLTIAIPYDLSYAGFEDSYYVEWLEEQSGYKIDIEYLSETYTTDYLNMIFTSKNSDVDAVLFANDNAPTSEELQYYIESGYLMQLDAYIENRSHLKEAMEGFSDYDLESTLKYQDGQIYYMPSLTLSETQCYLQTAWINVKWLEQLGMEIPSTTDELKITLEAFKKMDEYSVPLIGSMENENTFICNYLLNSFTTCDPFNYYFAVNSNNELYYPPITDEWREGIGYCRELYQEGILVDENFTYSENELQAICNDSSDVVGMFAAKGLSGIIYDDSPQLLSYFLVVPPLNETGTVTLEAQLPEVGGFILNGSEYKDEAFELLDLMCSEKAYLVSHYGKYQEDWTYASDSAVSVLGYPAEITMIGAENLQRNPSDATVLGPYITDVYYADRVEWIGYQVVQAEYMQARAYRTYQNYEAEYNLDYIAYTGEEVELENYEMLAAYVKSSMVEFIRGIRDIEDDEVWNAYIETVNEYKSKIA